MTRSDVIKYHLKNSAKALIPQTVYRPIVSRWRRLGAPSVAVALPGKTPLSRINGLDRGTPIDRYYIQRFLSRYKDDIRGDTLEMGDPRYTNEFGTNVTNSHVLHLIAGNRLSTIVGNLESGEGIPANSFDCMLVINTFWLIYDVRSAIRNCYSALRSGGVLLANFAGVFPKCPYDKAWEADYWRFTSDSVRRLFSEAFPSENIEILTFGNVMTSAAFLYGYAAEELSEEDLNFNDPSYEVSIFVRAVKQ
jgi:SAM-dependent methyltransferase